MNKHVIAGGRGIARRFACDRAGHSSNRLCAFLMLLISLLTLTSGETAIARGPVSPPALPSDKALADAMLTELDAGFRIYETDHFTIGYDCSLEHLRPLVGRLEGTFDAVWGFAVKLGFDAAVPQTRLRVLFFEKQDDYAMKARALGVDPISAAGFYSHTEDVAVFSNTLTRPVIQQITREIERLVEQTRRLRQNGRGGPSANRSDLGTQISALRRQRDQLVEQFNKLVIQHEAAHQVLFHIGVHNRRGGNPLWLAEGLACQFEIPQSRNDGRLSTINHMRLADFRESLGVPRRSNRMSDDEMRVATARPSWLPLRDLVGHPSRFQDAGDHIAARYGQAWAVVYYLSRKQSDAFSSYLAKVARQTPARHATPDERLAAFESSFGAVEAVERRWVAFTLQLNVDWKAASR